MAFSKPAGSRVLLVLVTVLVTFMALMTTTTSASSADGHQQSRHVSTSVGVDQQCPQGYFCAYGPPGSVPGVLYIACGGPDTPIRWVGNGSYVNTCFPGTVATFKNSSHTVIGWSCPAYCASLWVNWTPIWYIGW